MCSSFVSILMLCLSPRVFFFCQDSYFVFELMSIYSRVFVFILSVKRTCISLVCLSIPILRASERALSLCSPVPDLVCFHVPRTFFFCVAYFSFVLCPLVCQVHQLATIRVDREHVCQPSPLLGHVLETAEGTLLIDTRCFC